ncbi:Aa-trans domain-containing protein [Aphelenchoides besseyi]|nr:Aa-trans domain-containing protein [Aphelenchoides besseyi]
MAFDSNDDGRQIEMQKTNVRSEFYPQNDSKRLSHSVPHSGSMNSKGQFVRHRGLSWPVAALFLIDALAGGGIVAIPAAIGVTAVWPGLFFAAFVCLMSTITSVLLGRCWAILQERYPVYRNHCRKPYAEIGEKAVGGYMKYFVSATINVNQFGVCVVYLLLSAKSINDGLSIFGPTLHFCLITLILATCLLPVTFLKSPESFAFVVIGGMICSVSAVTLIAIGSGMDYSLCAGHGSTKEVNTLKLLSGIGTLVFAFGGHSSFPTIQHDMRQPFNFDYSSYMAFSTLLLLYVPMAAIANIVYGSSIQASIINSLQTPWIQQSVNVVLLLHFILTFTLVLNPLNQEVEEFFGITHQFGWKRVVVRTSTLLTILFTGLTIPSFGPLLNLVGSSSTLLTVLVYPVLFYLYLMAAEKVRTEKKVKNANSDSYPTVTFMEMIQHTDWNMLFIGFGIITIGLIICFGSSIAAVIELTNAQFEAPCYVRWLEGSGVLHQGNLATICCGTYKNISQPGITCATENMVRSVH